MAHKRWQLTAKLLRPDEQHGCEPGRLAEEQTSTERVKNHVGEDPLMMDGCLQRNRNIPKHTTLHLPAVKVTFFCLH